MRPTLNKKSAPAEKNIISQIWFKYFPYWPLFLLLFLVSVTGAWLYLRYKTTPLYESFATLLIKDEKKGQDESKLMEDLDQLSAKKIIENEIEVLKSRTLMLEVVKNLDLYAPMYEKGEIKSLSAYSVSPVKVEHINPDSLNETGPVFYTWDENKQEVKINGKAFPASKWVQTPYGMLRFTPQYHIGGNNKPLYFSLVNPKKVALDLSGSLVVSSASKLASVINLRIRDEVPKRSEDILNELIAAYSRAAITDKNTLALKTLAFIDERLGYLTHDLDSIENKLQKYKSTRGAIDIGSQGNLFLQNVTALDQRMGDVNTQMAVLDQVQNYVQSKDNTGGIVPSTLGVSDPMLSQLLEKLYDQELQYEKLRKTIPENNPMLVSIRDQINKIRPSILENIQSQRTGLQTSKNNLQLTNNKFSSMLSSIPTKERDLVEISREQNVKSGIYNFLLQKKEETQLSMTSSMTNSRVVDKAQSSFFPVAPDRKKFYLMALIGALAIGVVLVSASEMLKRTIMFRHEIEKFTSVPVIAEVVYEKSDNPIVIGDGKRTFIAEQFRNLRASLPYIGFNNKKKKIIVTSTVSGEGKSFIVVNLGMSLAIAGKKVVLLEFDLSDPTLRDKLGITTNTKGLSDYLTDKAEFEEIVRRTPVHDNLFIIGSGPLPENPSELIMSPKVPELLNHLTEIFDCVILDSAPVGLLSDAYVLSEYCDATLYVVRHRHTRKVSIERLDENNKINELKNMGIVFNGVKARGFNKNGYGYGYGYGYIFKDDKQKQKRKQSKKGNNA